MTRVKASCEPMSLESLAMDFDGRARGFRGCDRKPFEILVRAAGHRHFRTDDIDRRLTAHFAPLSLSDLAQAAARSAMTSSPRERGSSAQDMEQSR